MEHPNLMPSETPAPVGPQSQSGWRTLVIVLITALIIVGGAAAGYWAYSVYGPSDGPEESESPSPSPERSGDVQWQEPEDLGDLGYIPRQEGFDCVAHSICPEYLKIGTFTGGPYVGDDVIHVLGYAELGRPEYYFVRTSQGGVLLKQHSDEFWSDPNTSGPSFTTDASYRIPELIYPDFLETPYEGVVLQRAGPFTVPFYGNRYWNEEEAAEFVEVFESPFGTVWTDRVDALPTPTPGPNVPYINKRFGFYLRAPDDSIITYVPVFGFMHNETVSVDWDSGYSSGDYIFYTPGGCGRSDFIAVVPPYDLTPTALRQVGTTTTQGWPVYELRDSNDARLRELFAFFVALYPQQDSPDGYDSFLSGHPLFFIEDPLGRLIQFRDKDLLPLAECGKPVIYLYPEEAGWFDVTVEPVGGMSVSDPEYGDGWHVYAEPNGSLYHPDTNSTYPYLFWEGTGGLYETPEKGWVVAKSDVDAFLGEKLTSLGLVGQEISDFKEFWLPRMQDAPWYFVTFMGNRYMDALAPLNVTPKPDTVIRVLMDFVELEEPIDVASFTIRTPERRGFTVVEWGGVLR